MQQTRRTHLVKKNHQERIPRRMIAIDTESRSYTNGDVETQEWRTGCGIRWRTDTKSGDFAEVGVFDSPKHLWSWVSDYCRNDTRTIVWAHNLSHDVRISEALTILPTLGYTLEWCNLDHNVSVMTWRSAHGTIVLADTFTWLPVALSQIGEATRTPKFSTPPKSADLDTWNQYCLRDCQIVYLAVSQIVAFIRDSHLGNWQPTGAGMALSTWRHRFMEHKILVHDNQDALRAERAAMHTGRAEAWKHGKFSGRPWTEVDLRNAYVTIAAECDLPRKLRYHVNSISIDQFYDLLRGSAVLCLCDIRATTPAVPYKTQSRYIWPTGNFTSWLWDTEVDCAIRYGCDVHIRQAYIYAKAPILQTWGKWILSNLRDRDSTVPPAVRTWLKHCSRALIGRLALKTRTWEEYGANPEGWTGISHLTDVESGVTRRLLHVGDVTMVESDARESDNSLPMIPGWVMSECRVRLWDAMNAAGLDQVAHVDTDSILLTRQGLAALQAHEGQRWLERWQVKGSWRTVELRGPRNYTRGRERVVTGVPRRAEQVADGVYEGERWASLAFDLESRGDGVVTTYRDTWNVKTRDPRRRDAPGVTGETVAYEVGSSGLSNMSSAPTAGTGS